MPRFTDKHIAYEFRKFGAREAAGPEALYDQFQEMDLGEAMERIHAAPTQGVKTFAS